MKDTTSKKQKSFNIKIHGKGEEEVVSGKTIEKNTLQSLGPDIGLYLH